MARRTFTRTHAGYDPYYPPPRRYAPDTHDTYHQPPAPRGDGWHVKVFYILGSALVFFALYYLFVQSLTPPRMDTPRALPTAGASQAGAVPRALPTAEAVPAQPAQVEAPAPAQTLPTAVVNVAPVEAAPVVKPLRFATQPTIQPTAWVPDATQTAAYDAVRGTPAPQTYGDDPSCNSSNATYVTDPITIKDKNGLPIGVVQGWSCESEAAAVSEAQKRAAAMVQP